MTDTDYEEDLKKEKKRRKFKMYGKLAGLIIMGALIIMVYLQKPDYYRIYYIVAGVYIVYISYKLIHEFDEYRSLMDDLVIEKGHILKYNSDVDREIMSIPIQKIKKVYYNIEELPRTLYIVYKKDKKTLAENFYKTRIEEKEKFLEMMDRKDLLVEDTISFKKLKEKVESS